MSRGKNDRLLKLKAFTIEKKASMRRTWGGKKPRVLGAHRRFGYCSTEVNLFSGEGCEYESETSMIRKKPDEREERSSSRLKSPSSRVSRERAGHGKKREIGKEPPYETLLPANENPPSIGLEPGEENGPLIERKKGEAEGARFEGGMEFFFDSAEDFKCYLDQKVDNLSLSKKNR